MQDSATLLWGVLFGGIGIGYFIYGKKQKMPVAFFSGVGLFVVPYLTSNNILLVIACLVLMALPFVVNRFR